MGEQGKRFAASLVGNGQNAQNVVAMNVVPLHAADLVKLELNLQPGLIETSIGTWTEKYAKLAASYNSEREDILSSLRLPFVGIR